jgi:hypothetical protein
MQQAFFAAQQEATVPACFLGATFAASTLQQSSPVRQQQSAASQQGSSPKQHGAPKPQHFAAQSPQMSAQDAVALGLVNPAP